MRYEKTGYRSYEAEAGEVDIQFCQNAPDGRWRLRDGRGASKERPKPLAVAMTFHRTLADAKRTAEAATWHLT